MPSNHSDARFLNSMSLIHSPTQFTQTNFAMKQDHLPRSTSSKNDEFFNSIIILFSQFESVDGSEQWRYWWPGGTSVATGLVYRSSLLSPLHLSVQGGEELREGGLDHCHHALCCAHHPPGQGSHAGGSCWWHQILSSCGLGQTQVSWLVGQIL